MSASQERVAVVTGASAGLGKEAAKALAAQGFRVIALGRDPGRSAAALDEIRAASSSGKADMIVANLSLLADAARAAREVAALTDRVDVLVNNAGGMAKEKVITSEGFEENFTGNHVGPFLLTSRLIPLLKRAAQDAPKGSVRIVNTSSDASEMIPGLNFDDLMNFENFSVGAAYCGSKLANVLHARGLAKRLAGDGIIANSFHPGTVDSNFITHAGESTQAYMRTLEFISSEQGADTAIWLATSEDAGKTSGGYFYKRAPRTPNPMIEDDAAVERLFVETEKLILKAGV